MKIGVFGPDGRLGSELVRRGCIPIDCDITDKDDTQNAVNGIAGQECDLYINCAAYTAVDRCEDDDEYAEARQVNVWGLHNITNSTKKPVIYISTDYVFSGQDGPYDEEEIHFSPEDEVLQEPVNRYGWSKFGGEVLAMQLTNCYIVRTTGLWGSGNDFLETVTTALQKEQPIVITNELYGNQTYIPHLVDGLLKYAVHKPRPKVLHIASRGVISRYKFALMIAKKFDFDMELISSCRNRDVPGWVAKRPTWGGLRTILATGMGIPIYTIAEGLDNYAGRMKM